MLKKVALRGEGGFSLGAGGMIVLAFFLPMFRGCGRFDVTGYQAAAKASVLYAPLLVGVLALLAGFALLRLRRRWWPTPRTCCCAPELPTCAAGCPTCGAGQGATSRSQKSRA